MTAFSMWARRAVAYPLLGLALVLTAIAEAFLHASAWLVDAEIIEGE